MVFQGCSDGVESRVEQLFSMPNVTACSLTFGFGTAPTRWPLGDAGLLTKGSMQRAGLPYKRLRQDVNRSGSTIETHDWIVRGDHESTARRISLLAMNPTFS